MPVTSIGHFTKDIDDTTAQIDVASVTLSNDSMASIFVHWSAFLDDGTTVHYSSGLSILSIHCDGSGVVGTTINAEQSTSVKATDPGASGGFVLAFGSYSTTSPAEIVCFVSGYSGASPASGNVTCEITDIRGNLLKDL